MTGRWDDRVLGMRRPPISAPRSERGDEPLALLLLPGPLEGFALEARARALLSIPRVMALESSSRVRRRFLVDATSISQARRLRLPGRLRVVVLYHPAQYPLARALCALHAEAELWYVAPARESLPDDPELVEFDEGAHERAAALLSGDAGAGEAVAGDEPLRRRLLELGVISHRPFIPAARFARSRRREE
jgi:hypothetical protein